MHCLFIISRYHDSKGPKAQYLIEQIPIWEVDDPLISHSGLSEWDSVDIVGSYFLMQEFAYSLLKSVLLRRNWVVLWWLLMLGMGVWVSIRLWLGRLVESICRTLPSLAGDSETVKRGVASEMNRGSARWDILRQRLLSFWYWLSH